MGKTAVVYARIDTDLKDNAEGILSQLGISPTSAIQMLYSQIVLTRSFPLDLKLKSNIPTSIGNMTREELDIEIMKGIESIKAKKLLTADEVDEKLSKEFGI